MTKKIYGEKEKDKKTVHKKSSICRDNYDTDNIILKELVLTFLVMIISTIVSYLMGFTIEVSLTIGAVVFTMTQMLIVFIAIILPIRK